MVIYLRFIVAKLSINLILKIRLGIYLGGMIVLRTTGK